MPTPIKKSSNEVKKSPVPQAQNETVNDNEVMSGGDFDGLDFKSKEESSKSDFAPLKENIYDVVLTEAVIAEQARYQKPNETERVIKCTFSVEGRADNRQIEDIEGGICDNGFRRLWSTLSLRSVGFKNGGAEPGKTRSAIAALLGVNPDQAFSFSSLDDIIGKSCKVFVSVVENKSGQKKNKIDRYMTT